MHNTLFRTTAVTCNDGRGSRHGLDRHDAKVFVRWRVGHGTTAAKQRQALVIGKRCHEHDPVIQLELRDDGFQLLQVLDVFQQPLVVSTGHDEPRFRPAVLPAVEPLAARVALMISGVVLNGAATGLYIAARFGPGPRDGLMTGLHQATGRSVRLVRTGIEVLVVASGFLLGGTVGIGTVVYALSIGPLAQWFLRLFAVPAAPAPAPAPAPGGAILRP